VARSRGSGRVRYRLQYRHTVRTHISTSITIGPSLTGLRGTQLTGSIIYTLVIYYLKNEGCMGYRDFESFNLAMLAKQVWRLINDPNSLCSRVLRAKYYPDGDILKAGPKSGCSFTWKGILAGVSTFKRCYIWRVGNGEKVNIWTNPWIQSSIGYKVTSLRGGAVYTKVSELISPLTGSWDVNLLGGLFNHVMSKESSKF
jgi:hypothetical protein